MQWADLTGHAALYKDTYWGSFPVKPGDEPTDTILRNRNRFVPRYQIVAVSGAKGVSEFLNGLGDMGDHVEIYRARGGRYVVVTSPYDIQRGGHPLRPKIPEGAKALGFKLAPQMYLRDASTYVAVFKTLSELKLAIRVVKTGVCARK